MGPLPDSVIHSTRTEIDTGPGDPVACPRRLRWRCSRSLSGMTATLTTDSPELQSETIGRPIPHCEVKVVNIETLKTVPVGTIGEFWVRGFMTMSGYYGQPEATKAALTEDGWLRTGDLGTMDENGYFRITGRLKEMIIRGGMNLYPK